MLRLTASASSFFGMGVGGLDTGGVEDEAGGVEDEAGGAEDEAADEPADEPAGLTTAGGDGCFFFCAFLFEVGTSLGPDIAA